MVIMYLTCANQDEAQKISTALLEAKLIACVRHSLIDSSYWWDGKINHDGEVLIMMETIEEKFDAIEGVVTKLHSYDEFVLTAVPVLKTTPGVEAWLSKNLAKD
ncbi:divalent-cation tolerance protein CutA [Candidatus Saccharibacteria bacterium]|nr:MAG: divalent-cation tolerance protein CutA [Candidatus Saccharibacteria bacterium]